jgi:hypothetical protein
MKYVIWSQTSKHFKAAGYTTKNSFESVPKNSFQYNDGPVIVEQEFEANSSEEARDVFDAWDDARTAPNERCPICEKERNGYQDLLSKVDDASHG